MIRLYLDDVTTLFCKQEEEKLLIRRSLVYEDIRREERELNPTPLA